MTEQSSQQCANKSEMELENSGAKRKKKSIQIQIWIFSGWTWTSKTTFNNCLKFQSLNVKLLIPIFNWFFSLKIYGGLCPIWKLTTPSSLGWTFCWVPTGRSHSRWVSPPKKSGLKKTMGLLPGSGPQQTPLKIYPSQKERQTSSKSHFSRASVKLRGCSCFFSHAGYV